MSKLDLQHILGSSTSTMHQMSYTQQCLIYVAGAFIIFYNPIVDEQISYLKHTSPLISCITSSANQKYIAVASLPYNCMEKTLQSHQSRKSATITVYSVEELGLKEPSVVITLKGHKHQIDHIVFSPDSKYIVSICNTDGSMFVWNIETGQRMSQNKNSRSVNCIKFSPDKRLLSCGRGNIKIWQFYSQDGQTLSRTQEQDKYILTGSSLALSKKFSPKQFVSLCFKDKLTIALTSCGLLCLFQEEKMSKCIDLIMTKTTDVSIYKNTVMCAGDNAIVKIIDLEQLSLVGRFPKPPPMMKENIDIDGVGVQDVYDQGEQFPLCVGVKTIGNNQFSQFIVTLYQNKTMFIWRPQLHEMLAMRSIITHQQKITELKLLQQYKNDLTFFSTISLDNTLRIWHIYKKCFENRESIDIAQLIGIKRNAYCRNLTRIIYMQSEKPVVSMNSYKKKYIACLAELEFIMYELQSFQVVCHQTFEQPGMKLQIRDDTVYIAFKQGKVGIYSVDIEECRLNKTREIAFKNQIRNMFIFPETKILSILTEDTHEILLYSLSSGKIIHIQKQISSVCSSGTNILIYKNITKSLNIISTSSNNLKSNVLVGLSHQLIEGEKVQQMHANSLHIVGFTDRNRLIVCSLSKSVLCVQPLPCPLSSVQVSESGQIICAGEYGQLLIYRLQGYGGMEDEVKKWMKGAAWLDGSVFKRGSDNALKGSVVDSVRLRGSMGSQYRGSIQLPNVQIAYKKNGNDQSIFNPMDILQQAKNIYKNIDKIEKKVVSTNQEKEPQPKNPLIQFEDEGLQQISVSKNSKNRPPHPAPKKRIFGLSLTQKNNSDSLQQNDEGLPQQFRNNLVNSVVHGGEHTGSQEITQSVTIQKSQKRNLTESNLPQSKNKIIQKQKSKQGKEGSIGNFSDFMESKVMSIHAKELVRDPGEFSQDLTPEYEENQLVNQSITQNLDFKNNQDFKVLDFLQEKIQNQEFVSTNRQQLEKIYLKLKNKFSDNLYIEKQKVLEQFQKLCGGFVSFVNETK